MMHQLIFTLRRSQRYSCCPYPQVALSFQNCSFELKREISAVSLLSVVDASYWIDVLIPAFGRCEVERRSLIYRELPLQPNRFGGVTSLPSEFGTDPDPERSAITCWNFVYTFSTRV
ncbi:hypothetical protein F441_12457 [Phytophthora nicotianae CJ01A1]|uniref:Uncharacterized protein n=3 Tax=Phytophthora nicotianae TaxID=4792 RepID=V9EV84_PHYNI|nr:hypothetical protein F443_12493 [Phytophthora nicotianae P1569]ETL35785.1 hypothetical protein L916_12129 [Phytophthora nicotianae]ETP12117.1 hypothetical protein F441_12457 [Phytophthora nicotianae CJ01A1]